MKIKLIPCLGYLLLYEKSIYDKLSTYYKKIFGEIASFSLQPLSFIRKVTNLAIDSMYKENNNLIDDFHRVLKYGKRSILIVRGNGCQE